MEEPLAFTEGKNQSDPTTRDGSDEKQDKETPPRTKLFKDNNYQIPTLKAALKI